ncbi:ABC transporter permease [Flagellimonas aequoris]|uniref:ABC transporter permease n=1 Tax=Flagellimonas aequoris TaxID=2306997 RepID=A0A418N675_9FLAO|nr:ABC transporter permease [Allomuricauda aequoris]RIV69520.1 ABC transporter permease [Allomuricauda aequoris]TXK01115.1 FtsX-like permease family protein [Allomuricauda aequoris]
MNNLKLAFRRLFRKGEHAFTRIISLTAGLAFGILLLSEVLYYYSYDSFYPDADRIYVVHENFKMDKSSDKLESFPRVSGAIAPGLKAEVPGIEAATRLNSIGDHVIYTDDLNSYDASISLADEHLFDVLPIPMISGNPQEILKSPMTCMVSQELAENIGGDVVGKVISIKNYPNKELTIGGVFKTLPENTNYTYDILVSMVSTTQFFSWDGTTNWMGNDRYYACVKLSPGTNPKDLAHAVRAMQVKHQDIEKMEEEQQGIVLQYSFMPIKKIHVDNVKDMIVILSTIALAVLFVSLMNYILLTMGTLVTRAKSSAIHKTCGAETKNLQQMIFSETAVLFLVSIVGALLMIWALKPMAEAQWGHSLSSVLNPYVIVPLALLVVSLIFVTSYFPGRFFSRVPVATAFRDYQQKRGKWKLVLLSFQFVGATFILTVLVIVTLQYNSMKNADHGYSAEGVYYGSTEGMDGNKLSTVLNELRAMPEIETVGLGYDVPISGASGNNVLSPDEKRDLFNVADFYEADGNYLSILGIKVDEGEDFTSKEAIANDVLISKKGAELLKLNNGWTDGVLGKQITVTEHGSTTIRGVFPDFVVRSISDPDVRPSVFFYLPEERFEQLKIENPSMSFNIMVKAHEGAQEGLMSKITEVFNLGFPYDDAEIKSLEAEQLNAYKGQKGFRNAMLIGNIIILLVTIIGLLGYTFNESARRRKELAIRRINGATLWDILKAFISDLEYVAVPAVLLGLIGAWFTADKWMQNFAFKVHLHWGLFAACSLFILLLVALIAGINYTRTANQNPVDALRQE